jgi:hypothetical protein
VGYNNISVSISSSESDSEIRAMSSAIVRFARLQETTTQCAHTPCHAVFPVLRLSVLRPPASQCAPGVIVSGPMRMGRILELRVFLFCMLSCEASRWAQATSK